MEDQIKNVSDDREWRHALKNHLAVIGTFIGVCENLEMDEDCRRVLQNAERSYLAILGLVDG